MSVFVCASVLHTSNGLPMTEPTPPVSAPARNFNTNGASGESSPAPRSSRTGASDWCGYIFDDGTNNDTTNAEMIDQ